MSDHQEPAQTIFIIEDDEHIYNRNGVKLGVQYAY
jgi:hypothetical protein